MNSILHLNDLTVHMTDKPWPVVPSSLSLSMRSVDKEKNEDQTRTSCVHLRTKDKKMCVCAFMCVFAL